VSVEEMKNWILHYEHEIAELEDKIREIERHG